MQLCGNLDMSLGGGIKRAAFLTGDFPADPKLGEFVFKNKCLYMCVEIDSSLPFWLPITQEINTYRLDVTNPSAEWIIQHNFNTNFVLVQLYDDQGRQIIPDDLNAGQANRVIATFNMPMSGVAIVIDGTSIGLPKQSFAFQATFSTSTTWVVQHNLGYNPAITCISGDGYVVQPESIVHNSPLQATITFSSPVSGSVRCV